jgi:hypothetical protein
VKFASLSLIGSAAAAVVSTTVDIAAQRNNVLSIWTPSLPSEEFSAEAVFRETCGSSIRLDKQRARLSVSRKGLNRLVASARIGMDWLGIVTYVVLRKQRFGGQSRRTVQARASGGRIRS